MSSEHQAWLDGLKVGDEVAVMGFGIGCSVGRLLMVTRITKTLIVIDGRSKFRKRDGYTFGQGYSGSSLVEPTQDRRDEIEHYLLYRTLQAAVWRDLPLTTLRKVNELVKAASGKAER